MSGDPPMEIQEGARAESMREALRQLIDELPESGLEVATTYLTSLRDDPVFLALETAPVDDEELAPDEREEIAQAMAERARGTVEYVSMDDVRREIGW